MLEYYPDVGYEYGLCEEANTDGTRPNSRTVNQITIVVGIDFKAASGSNCDNNIWAMRVQMYKALHWLSSPIYSAILGMSVYGSASAPRAAIYMITGTNMTPISKKELSKSEASFVSYNFDLKISCSKSSGADIIYQSGTSLASTISLSSSMGALNWIDSLAKDVSNNNFVDALPIHGFQG